MIYQTRLATLTGRTLFFSDLTFSFSYWVIVSFHRKARKNLFFNFSPLASLRFSPKLTSILKYQQLINFKTVKTKQISGFKTNPSHFCYPIQRLFVDNQNIYFWPRLRRRKNYPVHDEFGVNRPEKCGMRENSAYTK